MSLHIRSLPRPGYIRAQSGKRLQRCYHNDFPSRPCSSRAPIRLPFPEEPVPTHAIVPPLFNGFRLFTTCVPHLKKSGGKQNNKPVITKATQKTSVPGPSSDPFDLSDYEFAIGKAHEHLRSEVSKLKAGGRDVDAIENIRVNLGKGKEKGGNKGDGGSSSSSRVGDLASVVQRGRNVVVMVGEKDHLKPITSALQSTEGLNPQTSTTGGADPLHITIPIPPTTRESRQAASKVAHEKGEAALFALREARGAQKKRLRAMELARKVLPDDLKKAEREMEKVNEQAGGEVKKVVEEARKRLEGG